MKYIEALSELKKMYPSRLVITKKEFSLLCARSIPAIDRDLASDTKISQMARREKRRVFFAIPDVARYLSAGEG